VHAYTHTHRFCETCNKLLVVEAEDLSASPPQACILLLIWHVSSSSYIHTQKTQGQVKRFRFSLSGLGFSLEGLELRRFNFKSKSKPKPLYGRRWCIMVLPFNACCDTLN
jgi:hypothetical protein